MFLKASETGKSWWWTESTDHTDHRWLSWYSATGSAGASVLLALLARLRSDLALSLWWPADVFLKISTKWEWDSWLCSLPPELCFLLLTRGASTLADLLFQSSRPWPWQSKLVTPTNTLFQWKLCFSDMRPRVWPEGSKVFGLFLSFIVQCSWL